MAIKHFTFASLLLFVSLYCAVAQHDLRPRSMTQLANLPETLLEKRGEHESIAYLGKRPSSIARAWHSVKNTVSSPFRNLGQRLSSFKKRSEEESHPVTEKKPHYLGHKRDLSEIEYILVDHEYVPDEGELFVVRTPGHSAGDLRFQQNRKEKLQKLGRHEQWMDMVPDRDGSFDPTPYIGSGVPKMIRDMRDKLQKQGIHKDWMDKPAAKAVARREDENAESNILVKRRTGDAAAENVAHFERYEKRILQAKGLSPLSEHDIKTSRGPLLATQGVENLHGKEGQLMRRAYTVFDASKCNMPLEKTGPSGNKVVLTTGCEYHGLGLGTSHRKRDIQQPSHQLQKRFVVLPPFETDKGLRFDISREDAKDGIVFLKRSPNPDPNAALVTAAASFANSFSQTRNYRKQTVVLNSDSDGNITGARTINTGGPRKLININLVSHRQPRVQHYQHQHQHETY
ncbi:uncharacterized protein FA14DRAFT_182190 [Meira miltonrushii]|uniref:Uncharacterized protein n=1 Tax=Meira miltonrushii TaxID=1280837 RepID=A0A316V704_9BASI|nr:uncharacterized protein FA14DRAFT_182190 [Meira miltonrushii]PWN32281.1 hypothetical protein FA14DRAFT_182190 [Meira miltonrushii]